MGLASVAQPPGKCLGSVALRPAISDGLPLSVIDVRIFDIILGGVNRNKAKAMPRESVRGKPTHTGRGSHYWYGFGVNKSEVINRNDKKA